MIRSLLRLSLVCLAMLGIAACSGTEADAELQAAGAGPAASPEQAQAPPQGGEPGAPPEGAVATVNGAAISASELEGAVATFLRGQGLPPTPPADQADMIRDRILDALIGRELLHQLGVEKGISPSGEEVDAALIRLKEPFPSEEEWSTQLASQGLTEAGVRSMLQRSLVIEQVIRKEVGEKIQLSDTDVRKYYDEHPEEMQRPEEVRASHILFRVESGAAEEIRAGARGRAEAVLAEARSGKDFADLARQHSEDPGSAAKGGDLGYFQRGMTVPPFEAAAFALGIDKISDLVESPFGFHIIKVTGRRDAGLMPFEDVSARLAGFLEQKRTETGMRELIDSLRAGAAIEIF